MTCSIEKSDIDPITPGELLLEEFLKPMGLSQYRLAKLTGIPAQRIGQIVLGRRRVSADTDLRLCKFFGLTDGYWLRAQAAYDTEITRRKIADELQNIKLYEPNQEYGFWEEVKQEPHLEKFGACL